MDSYIIYIDMILIEEWYLMLISVMLVLLNNRITYTLFFCCGPETIIMISNYKRCRVVQ